MQLQMISRDVDSTQIAWSLVRHKMPSHLQNYIHKRHQQIVWDYIIIETLPFKESNHISFF